MKKKVFSIIGVIAFAGAVVFSAIIGTSGSYLSDLALTNVEALAQNENGGGSKLDCFLGISFDGTINPTHKTDCSDCTATLCRWYWSESTCTP